jgi:hypothetical protein
MRNNHYANVVTVASCLVINGWALAKPNVLGFLQEPEKVILQDVPLIGKDPLEITEIKVKGKALKVAEKFVEDGEWLNEATFKLKNTYSKPITYIQINVDFPEIERRENGAILEHQIYFGRHPIYKSDERPEIRILPGDSIEVSLASEYERIKRMIELAKRTPEQMKRPISYISKTVIGINEVAFDDGTLYSGGRMHVRNPDPDGRQKWIPIKE